MSGGRVAKAREREESEFLHHPCCADTPLATASEAAFNSTIQFMSLVDNELVQRARCRWAGFKIAFSQAGESHPALPCRPPFSARSVRMAKFDEARDR